MGEIDKIPTVREIVKAWLEEHGYDGLYNPYGECGCALDDFMPCNSEGVEQCEAAHKIESDDDDYDFLMVPGKRGADDD